MVVLFATGLSGCRKNPERVLPARDGKWTALLMYSDDSFSLEFEEEWQFLKRGEGNWKYQTQSGDFTWTHDRLDDDITIVRDGHTYTYEVVSRERNSELWKLYAKDDIVIYFDHYELSVELTRKN